MGGERHFLADIFDPSFLMDLCDGLTDFQALEAIHPFLGTWIRITGTLFQATPNPAFGTAGVTIHFPTAGGQRDAFLTFHRDLDRLGLVRIGDGITAEGQIKSISSHTMVLDRCGLADPRIVAIRKVSAAADELTRAAEDWGARREAALPAPQSQPKLDPDEAGEELPDVDFEHLTLWYAAFAVAYPNSSEELALKSARGAFPLHKVRRQWVRDLRGARPMGRPSKNKGN